jgi:hypothetical protein
VIFATVQLLMPGVGVDWFSDEFRPDGWEAGERVRYLLIETVPLAIFIITGVIFYFAGTKVREEKAVVGSIR